MFFNFTTAVTVLKPKKIKSATVSVFSPFIFYEVMGPDAIIVVFSNVKF